VRQSFLSENWHCQIDCWKIQCYSLTFNAPWQLRQAGKPDFACNFPSRLQLGSSSGSFHILVPAGGSYKALQELHIMACPHGMRCSTRQEVLLKFAALPDFGCSVAAHSSIHRNAASFAGCTVCLQGLKLKLRLRRPWRL